MIGQQRFTPFATIQTTPTRRMQRGTPFTSECSSVWYGNEWISGEDKHEDGDTDSLTSEESSESVATPESSPPRDHAILQGEHVPLTPAVGAFDANGNWVWSNGPSKDKIEDPCLLEEGKERSPGSANTTAASMKPVLNRHDRAQITMAGGVNKLTCQLRASDVLWSDTGNMTQDILQEGEEDMCDVVGYKSYTSRPVASPRMVSEGHSLVVPIRIRLEDDSSSDESEVSIISSSSGGSDSEARRRASINMLHRLGKTITIPQRRASVFRPGQGPPRRPPSLVEISTRVVAGVASPYGKGTPPGSAGPHQRSVSCPSPSPLLRERFGEVEVMVTPPTPQMSAEKIPGVVLRNPHMPSCTFSTDTRGNLIPPAFDVAPGRQIMLDERERQTKLWLENFKSQQQERHVLNLKLGACPIAPPVAYDAQAAAMITPSSPILSRAPSFSSQDGAETLLQQDPGAPPIPPCRRSFGRRISAQPALLVSFQTYSTYSEADAAKRPADRNSEVPARVCSPVNLPASKPDDLAQSTTRRSLVARLSMRRSSKELREERIRSQTLRRPVSSA